MFPYYAELKYKTQFSKEHLKNIAYRIFEQKDDPTVCTDFELAVNKWKYQPNVEKVNGDNNDLALEKYPEYFDDRKLAFFEFTRFKEQFPHEYEHLIGEVFKGNFREAPLKIFFMIHGKTEMRLHRDRDRLSGINMPMYNCEITKTNFYEHKDPWMNENTTAWGYAREFVEKKDTLMMADNTAYAFNTSAIHDVEGLDALDDSRAIFTFCFRHTNFKDLYADLSSKGLLA